MSVLCGRLLKYFAFSLAMRSSRIGSDNPEHGKKVVDGKSRLIDDDADEN